VARLAEMLAQTLREPLRTEGRELAVSASVGVAIRAETHVSGDALLQAARRAAQAARAAGTGQWRLVDD
jgi:GGDEF domain-containing protein